MAAVRKSEKPEATKTGHQSGEHVIGIDALIRRSIEKAFSEIRVDEPEADPQMTSRMNAFDLAEALAKIATGPSQHPTDAAPPETPISEAPTSQEPTVQVAVAAIAAMVARKAEEEDDPKIEIVSDGVVELDELPMPAVEIDRTK